MGWVLILLTFGQVHGYAIGGSTTAIAVQFQSQELCEAALAKLTAKTPKADGNGYTQEDLRGYCLKTKE